MAHKLGVFLTGGLLGAGIALLYAPHTGAETRQCIANRAMQMWGQAQDLGNQAAEYGQEMYDDAVEYGQELYTEATEVGKQVYSQATTHATAAAARATTAVNNVKPVFAEKNDELRHKIDAARERIAAQVAKNAEVAQATAVVEPAAEEGVAPVVEYVQVDETKAVQAE